MPPFVLQVLALEVGGLTDESALSCGFGLTGNELVWEQDFFIDYISKAFFNNWVKR